MLKKDIKVPFVWLTTKNFKKYSFKDVLLAWSRFLKKSHQVNIKVTLHGTIRNDHF